MPQDARNTTFEKGNISLFFWIFNGGEEDCIADGGATPGCPG
jgi:hypothetical protein